MTRDEIGSSDIYSVDHQAIEDVWIHIPTELRRKPRFLRQSIRLALADVFRRGQTVEYLIERMVLYLTSSEARSPHFREIATWLDDEGYDEDSSVWNKRESRAQREPQDKPEVKRKPNPIWSDEGGYKEVAPKHPDTEETG